MQNRAYDKKKEEDRGVPKDFSRSFDIISSFS